MKKIKDFLKTKGGMHVYSFAKTYVTVFLGIYLTLHGVFADTDIAILRDMNLIDINIIGVSAKGACVSLLRNIYKLLTEK